MGRGKKGWGEANKREEKRRHTTLDIALDDDDTATESEVAEEDTRPTPATIVPFTLALVLPVLLLFFSPSSTKALPAAEDDADVLAFVNLNNGTDSKLRRFLEGVLGSVTMGRQSEQMMIEGGGGRMVEAFMQYTQVAVVVVVVVVVVEEAYMCSGRSSRPSKMTDDK